MVQRQQKLQAVLEGILGTRNVYFQEPSNTQMKYPCIKYSLVGQQTEPADDINYIRTREWDIVYIDRRPVNNVVDKLLDLPMSSPGRVWAYDGLNHTQINLYF